MSGKNKVKLTRKEKKQLKKEKRAQRSPVVKGIFLGLKAMFITMAVIVVGLMIVFYFTYGKKLMALKKDADRIIAMSTEDTFRISETTQCYDVKGNLLSELKGDRASYYIEYDEIPKEAVKAMISIEDKKYLRHNGVDIMAIGRAALELIRHKGKITEGASTITQQLSRNIFLTTEVSWERKFKEIFIALAMEKKYSKEQIMEFYLNNIYFANGYYGIEAASRGYFSKSVSELNMSEITFLCAIPNNPTMYNPLENKQDTMERRERILNQMLNDGLITKAEFVDARDTKVKLDLKTVKKRNYLETYLYHCATEALMEANGFELKFSFDSDKERKKYDKEYSEFYNECHQSLYTSGYQIYTSLNVSMQRKLQSKVDEVLKDFTEKNEEGIYKLQGAAVCIDNSNGKVAAIVGGRTQKSDYYTLNRAYQSFRQPGSTMKPLLVYTPAFEMGYSPDSVVEDSPIEDGPKNADGTYSGNIRIRTAVQFSKNTTAWRLLEVIGIDKGLSYLKNMQFSKISDGDRTLAAALGGLTTGVSAVEMASAYSTIENDGVFRNPGCIMKILDSDGNLIYAADEEGVRIYEQNACRMSVSTLQTVMTSGTGSGCRMEGYDCAGKTGTTNDLKDGWFVGFTKYYTTSVWVGYDIPKELSSLAGNSYPGWIWKAFMQELHQERGLENVPFSDYEKISGIDESKPIGNQDKTPEPQESLAPTDVPDETPEPEPEPGDETDYDDSHEGDSGDEGDIDDEGTEDDNDGTETPPPDSGEDGNVTPPPVESDTPSEDDVLDDTKEGGGENIPGFDDSARD